MAKHYTADDPLKKDIQEILETWPLYREHAYTGADNVVQLPRVIQLFCPRCRKELWWQRSDYASSSDKTGFDSAAYTCKNCSMTIVRYYFYWAGGEAGSLFLKVGQHPPLEEHISPELEQQLTPEDLGFYKKAIRCRNFNYGLGAVAYLRRVVENRMNALLDLIAQAARDSGFAQDELNRLEQVKGSKRFDDKVTYAAGILPNHLRPGGQNPIDRLHDIASDALHSRPDEECLEIFDKTRLVFEHVFKKLQVSAAEAKVFVEALKELERGKTAKSSIQKQT